jgi:hypothetical protein
MISTDLFCFAKLKIRDRPLNPCYPCAQDLTKINFNPLNLL